MSESNKRATPMVGGAASDSKTILHTSVDGTHGDVPGASETEQSAATPRPSLIGATLGEYRVESELGSGGMGIVYRGLQPMIGKEVAIKVLRSEGATDASVVQQLLAEARAVNAIRHPGIVDIFSFGTTPDGRPYFVMELLQGEPLDAVLARRHHFPPVEAIDILDQVFAALDGAHEAGIIHRDLKPGNVHLEQNRDGSVHVKLLDFGLAKSTTPGNTAAQTSPDMIRGTPGYIAPEQARGKMVGPQTDLYSAGVMAFELLTGRLPFDAPSIVELLMKHVSEPPPLPTAFQPDIPDDLEKLVLGLLAKTPEDRPTSAAAVQRELRRIKRQLQKGATTIGRSPRAPAPAPKAPAPNRRPIIGWALAGLAGVVAAGGAGLMFAMRDPNGQAMPGVVPPPEAQVLEIAPPVVQVPVVPAVIPDPPTPELAAVALPRPVAKKGPTRDSLTRRLKLIGQRIDALPAGGRQRLLLSDRQNLLDALTDKSIELSEVVSGVGELEAKVVKEERASHP